MNFMFDQFEQDFQRSRSSAQGNRPETRWTGHIQMKEQDSVPIFSRKKVNFSAVGSITHLAICNDFLVLSMANNILLRFDLKHPDKTEEIDVGKYTSHLKLHSLFLDPTGCHLLLSFSAKQLDTAPELLYLAKKSTKLKQPSKIKNHLITAVAWNLANESEETTSSILLGTSKGLIFESEIGSDGDRLFPTSLEQYWRQVFDIGKGNNIPITGLYFERDPNSDKYFILVTTPNRLYQFMGNILNPEEKPLLQQIFNKYLSIPESFLEVPGKLSYSRLHCYHLNSHPTLGWVTQAGFYFGEVPLSFSKPFETAYKCLPYPTKDIPISLVLTEFHALLLYSDRICGISVLNQELIFEDIYDETSGKIVGIVKDPVKQTIWTFTEHSVFRYKVTRENRHVWQTYVDKGKFELAKEYCKDNPANLDQVLIKQAETLFDEKKYEESAKLYAETFSSFEEISLKFLQDWQIEALKIFLVKKLEKLKDKDKTQITMIVVWIIELFLNQLGSMRDNGLETSSEYIQLQKEFENFLALPQVKDCVFRNRETIYNLMSSHGDKVNLIRLTILNQDYEKVIGHHIQKNNYLEALDILKRVNRKDLFYRFSPALMQSIPKQTVQALIAQGRSLSPDRLLPALVSCDERQAAEVVGYLQFVIDDLGCQQQAIHNYLFTLYANFEPKKVLQYLSSQGQNPNTVKYDPRYALRLCQEKGLTEACVQISALLGLWETAIDLALTMSVTLATNTAKMVTDDVELSKKLWLKIAQHLVKEKDDIQEVKKFLKECDFIKIEDILPFFSDFVTIDHFKEAICASLQEYNQHIQDLKEEMDEATKSAEIIRGEIQGFRNRCACVRAHDLCQECQIQLLLRPFYLFPCGHHFHCDCLLFKVTPLLTAGKQSKLSDLQRQLNALSTRDDNSIDSSLVSAREQLKADIDGIVASECLYCGDFMIRTIDRPFIEEDEYENIIKDWE